jgi:hypothetical protein
LGIELLDGLGDKIQSSSWILKNNNMDLVKKAERYFELFSTKNVKGLENEIYADNIFLRDWNGEWRGKQAVLEMNENLFVNEFRIDNIQIKQADITTIVQFDLHIADAVLRVADVIDWNDNGKIERILAYNG